MIKILATFLTLLGVISGASADVTCSGTVASVYKWSTATTLSIQIKMSDGNYTNWIAMPSKSDEAIALTAFSTGKSVSVYWSASNISSCIGGWPHNTTLTGYFSLGG